MEGLGFDFTIIIWLVCSLVCVMSVFHLIKYFTKKEITRYSSGENIERFLNDFKNSSNTIRNLILLVWIIIAIIMVIFHGSTKYINHDDMGSENTKQESMIYEPPVKEEIETINTETINKEEFLREREVKEEQKKSEEEFKRFMEESLKGTK